MRPKRKLKIGVNEGGGPPPGYQWSVGVLDLANEEASDMLDLSQYLHLAMQVKELARQGDPSHSATIDVDAVEDIFEIRDKGGPLGSLNVRLFFGIDNSERAIIVLGVKKKQNNGKTPLGDKITVCRRWRKYLAGDYGKLAG